MTIFSYDGYTKEYLDSSTAINDPLDEGKYLIPANATLIEPLEIKEGYAICFDEQEENWVYIEDHRGSILFNIETKNYMTVTELGPLSTFREYTHIEPKDFEEWVDGKWVENTKLKEEHRVLTIKAKAGQIITSKYDIIKQMNIYGEGGDKQVEMVAWIKKIRDISNKAEADGIELDKINWEI